MKTKNRPGGRPFTAPRRISCIGINFDTKCLYDFHGLPPVAFTSTIVRAVCHSAALLLFGLGSFFRFFRFFLQLGFGFFGGFGFRSFFRRSFLRFFYRFRFRRGLLRNCFFLNQFHDFFIRLNHVLILAHVYHLLLVIILIVALS